MLNDVTESGYQLTLLLFLWVKNSLQKTSGTLCIIGFIAFHSWINMV